MTAFAESVDSKSFRPEDSDGNDFSGATRTLDLADLAQVARGEQVRVSGFNDKTVELFDKTLNLLDEALKPEAIEALPQRGDNAFVPQHEDLRSRFLFAEAVGSYSTLCDLLNAYSPGYLLSQRYGDHPKLTLSDPERAALEDYLEQLNGALGHANRYLHARAATDFTADELVELHKVLIEARERTDKVTAILGAHLIGQIEHAVERLFAFRQQTKTVHRSINGIFVVNSDIMFLPTSELIRHVETIFSGVGNAYLAEHIDGTLLLAARNLLIDAVSFYAYYGKQRIYDLYESNAGSINRNVITRHIRTEIRQLFSACKASNKLILSRMMNDAERQFELSVEAIQMEAEAHAVEAVRKLLPEKDVPEEAAKKPGLLRKLVGWLRGH